jgi:A/G-specific adenine glycosylase
VHHSADGNLGTRQSPGATPGRRRISTGGRDLTSTTPTRPGDVLDADRLAGFFAARGRDLPWRRPTVGGWGVLVSEVMLQQTPVSRVLPVYREWMARWPEPAALAGEPAGEAVRVWGRLGYPRRALRLHAAAVVLVRDHHGAVPKDLDCLRALPGVGEYTARAVAAFAYGQRHPVIDTNVRRVLSRAVRGIDEHGPATAADRAELAALLPVEPRRAATFSAAVMELGALVCTAAGPRCEECPLSERCAWLAAGRPAGPPRRPAQGWHGTDRQVRGAIMAVLRESPSPLPETLLAADRHDPAQWRRCLVSLLADGLAVRDPAGLITLP